MEIFKDVVGYEGRYQVSDKGSVKSLLYGKSRILKPFKNKQGYQLVKLSDGKNQKTISVHLIVAHAFLGHKSDGTQNLVVDHKDDNKLNNCKDNLQIITQRENSTKGKKVKGYSLHKKSGLYFSRIYINKESVHLGYFKTKEEASEAYTKALNEHKNKNL